MNESTKVEGGCLCGAVRFSLELPSKWCAHCHCSMCRRAHGAGYVTWGQVQAAIAALHCQAEAAESTDWPQIVALYDTLLGLHPSPVVALNRAVAVAMADGPASGLDQLDAIEHAGTLDGYRYLHAARAELFRRLGRPEEARVAFGRALELTMNAAERRFLQERLAE